MKNYTVSVFKVAVHSLPIVENCNLAFVNVCEIVEPNFILFVPAFNCKRLLLLQNLMGHT